MLWQPVSEHPTGECSRQDYCEDDKTNDQWIEHDRVPRLERLKKLEEATLLAKSAREATWFVVRPMAAAVNSTNEILALRSPCNSPAADVGFPSFLSLPSCGNEALA